MNIIFLGTPHFAVPALDALVNAGHRVLAVYTQPDRPKGRKQELAAPPVKEAALRHGLAVCQPQRVRRPEVLDELRQFDCQAMVIVGYGQIIPQNIIDSAPLGIINVHASLLPKYRGAAPIQWAIANGETVTGVTTMQIDAGLDTGDILLQRETAIGPGERAGELSVRLAEMGAGLLVQTMTGLERGEIVPIPQDPEQASFAPILRKEDGLVDWQLPAAGIYNRLRGFSPWPGCYTHFKGQTLNIWDAQPADSEPPHGRKPGAILQAGKRILVAAGGGSVLELLEVQLEGRKRVSAEAFSNGQRLTSTGALGELSS